MKSIKIFLALALGVFLVVPAYGQTRDPDSVNFKWPAGHYDYRHHGTWLSSNEGGAEAQSGAYFSLSVGVVLGDYLLNFEDVVEVKVKHIQTGREFSLVPDRCPEWGGEDIHFWVLKLKPANWMYQGTWEFRMFYNGSDGNVHEQVDDVEMGFVAFPVKPSNIRAFEQGKSIILSWSGIGNPEDGVVDYRVRFFSEEGCMVKDPGGVWKSWSEDQWGTYDAALNRVTFTIPRKWGGYRVRLENRINSDRGSQYLWLPEY